MTNRIQNLLNMNGVCSCGKYHPVSLRALVMERGALTRVPEILGELGNYHHLVMICDDNTYAAAGQTVEQLCKPFWERARKTY